jgi:hypothetical protein
MRRLQEEQHPAVPAASPVSAETAPSLEVQRQELESLKQQLLQTQQRLREQEVQCQQARQQLARDRQQMQLDSQALREEKDKWNREQAAAVLHLAGQREGTLRTETALREQRTALVRLLAELKQLHEAALGQENVDLAAARRENVQLQQLLADLQTPPPPQQGNPTGDLDQLRRQLEELGRLLADRDTLIEQLRQTAAASAPAPQSQALESYEAELNRFRLQLEGEKTTFQEEVGEFRTRCADLDRTNRETELAMSRERAELARERARLERVREEVRLEAERAQREAARSQRLQN